MSRTPTVPGYHLVDRLHRGPRADVWRATRASDGRAVAVKIPAPGPDGADVAAESVALGSGRHPNLLALLARVDLEDGRTALVTDLAEGGTLADLVAARGRLTVAESAALLAPVADALWSLHRSDIVHGDISPANVLLTQSGRPLLGDLGVARGGLGLADESWGTQGFVAPEVLAGGPRTTETDVWALGAVLVHALTGRGIAALEPVEDVIARCRDAGELPDEVAELLAGLLAGRAADRPRAIDAARALSRVAQPEPVDIGGRSAADLVTARVRANARAAAPRVSAATATETTRVRHRAGSREAGLARRAVRPVIVLATLAVVFVLAFGTTRVVASRVIGGPAQAAAPVATAPAATSAPAPAPSTQRLGTQAPSSSPAAPPSSARDLAEVQGAAATAPNAVLDAVLSRRSRALERGDAAELRHVDAPSSWAYERDAAIVADLAERQERAQGLTFRVEQARVLSASASRTLVQARVGVDPYAWRRPTARGTAPARPATEQRYTLVWFGGRWLIEKVEAA